jgi:hypothetical protein
MSPTFINEEHRVLQKELDQQRSTPAIAWLADVAFRKADQRKFLGGSA